MNAKEQLLAAAEYIEKHGWRQCGFGGYYPCERIDKCACVLGAIRSVDPEYRMAREKLTPWDYEATKAVRKYLGFEGELHAWNDAPERTQEEVVAALRGAAEAL